MFAHIKNSSVLELFSFFNKKFKEIEIYELEINSHIGQFQSLPKSSKQLPQNPICEDGFLTFSFSVFNKNSHKVEILETRP